MIPINKLIKTLGYELMNQRPNAWWYLDADNHGEHLNVEYYKFKKVFKQKVLNI